MTTAPHPLGSPEQHRPEPALEEPTLVPALKAIRASSEWLLLGLVFVVILELSCRVEDWITYRTPLASRAASLNDLVIRDADGMHGRANVRLQKWKMNSLGTRGPEASTTPAVGTLRVIAVGASETFGLRESPDREYPRQLEDSLNARVSRGGCGNASMHFEVLNAGFAGMTLPTIEQDVRLRLSRLRPDIVVIYPTPAQYLQDELPLVAAPDSAPGHGLPASNAVYPRFLNRFREQLKQVVPVAVLTRIRARQAMSEVESHPDGWRFETLPLDRLTQFENDLRRLVGAIQTLGMQPVLVTHANIFMTDQPRNSAELVSWEKFYPRATGEVIVALDSAARLATLRVGREASVVTIDAAARLSKAPRSSFGDFVHFTDTGASLVADEVSGGVMAAAHAMGRCAPSASSHHRSPESVSVPIASAR